MNLALIATKAVSALLLPPLNLILLCALGLLLRRRTPRAGLALSALALLTLTVISTPAGSLLLARPLENLVPPLASAQGSGAQAIVVLGGGRIAQAPEYKGHDLPRLVPLVRLRYTAALWRATHLPVLASGGAPDGATESEAALMARSLREDFGVPVTWIEGASNNTEQNAAYSADILRRHGVRRILLVTDSVHMPRAKMIFDKTGLDVVPAPASLTGRGRLLPTDFMPAGEALFVSHYAMHEWLGILWQSFRR